MSPSSWQTSLRQMLEQQAARQSRLPRIAILGIGNPLRSDDAAGGLVARRLAQSHFTRDLDSVLILDAGYAPENTTAEVRRFAAEIVILIDAAEMGEAPGAIRWVGINEIDGMSASTHTMPLSMLAKFLLLELDCEVGVLGIQPEFNEIGDSVSKKVLQAVDEIVNGLTRLLQSVSYG
jgi:hydrogenase 3 maturation protease